MNQFQFTITDNTQTPAVVTVIDEPVGWDGLEFKLARHNDWHGFFDYFDKDISMLEFDGVGFGILKEAYELVGVEAQVTLLIEFRCSETDSFEEIYEGNFDFLTYEQTCGDRCFIKINVNTTSCLVQFKNRYDQKVNIESLRTFDLPDGDADDLTAYAGINFEQELLPNQIPVKSAWDIEEPETETLGFLFLANTPPGSPTANYYRPGIPSIQSDIPDTISIEGPEVDTIPSSNFTNQLGYIEIPNPTNLDLTDIVIEWNFEGTFYDNYISGNGDGTVGVSGGNGIICLISKGTTPSGTTIHQENNVVAAYSIASDGNHSEDFSFSGSATIASLGVGQKLYVNFIWAYFVNDVSFIPDPLKRNHVWEYDTARIEVNAFLSTEPTTAKVSLINETASRVTEIITGDCLRVYSDYYGREDAEPYPSAEDGCGSLRVLSNGLFIRRALQTDDTEPQHTLSMKDIFEAMSAIDCVGMGVEPDPNRPGYEWLRIERFQYFYDPTVLMTFTGIAKTERTVHMESIFSTFKSGYGKYETETVGGRNEIHTKRNFRTTLKTIQKELVKICPFIASGHSIEITRWQVGNTSQDWRYDNDTFIICVTRDEESESGYTVQRGEDMPTADNLPNWETCYNVKITPQRNARRWTPIVFQCYVNFTNGWMKFMDGDGNLIASTFIFVSADCITQDASIPIQNVPENADISFEINPPNPYPFDAGNVHNFYPIFKPERVTFDYPLSYAQWKTIKAAPTQLIGFECNGTTEYGWIDELNYRPVEGMATFVLIPKQPDILGIGGG